MSAATDALAVTNLIARYAEAVDAGDFAAVGRLFADGVFVGSGGAVKGARAVEAMLRDSVILYEDGTPRTHHVTTNTAVEVADAAEDAEGAGSATASSYVTIFQAVPGLPLQPIAAGRYRDRFERRDGSWVFAERRVVIHLVGDVSRHLRG